MRPHAGSKFCLPPPLDSSAPPHELLYTTILLETFFACHLFWRLLHIFSAPQPLLNQGLKFLCPAHLPHSKLLLKIFRWDVAPSASESCKLFKDGHSDRPSRSLKTPLLSQPFYSPNDCFVRRPSLRWNLGALLTGTPCSTESAGPIVMSPTANTDLCCL